MKADSITLAGRRYPFVRMAADPSAGSSGVASEMPTDPIEVLRILRATIERIDQQLGNLTQHEMYSRSITVAAIDSALELLWGRAVLAQLQESVKNEIEYAPERGKTDDSAEIEEPGNIMGMALHRMTPAQRKEAQALRTAEAYELAEARRQEAWAVETARRALGGK